MTPRWRIHCAAIVHPGFFADGLGASSACPASGADGSLPVPATDHPSCQPHRMETSSVSSGASRQRGLTLECLCLEDRWSRAEALSCSSVLESWRTRFQVSWADISPSFSHLMLERSDPDTAAEPCRQEATSSQQGSASQQHNQYLRDLETVALDALAAVSSFDEPFFISLLLGLRWRRRVAELAVDPP